ncbi:RNA polymerase sigma factor [Arachidicoccus terrestris]|uniref:RNA polymerase sigma factor n=1 Tax=Arachidicoccus terrestris TaxID=2875539 RepID=UPI001CC56438|nr:sigma-70 family RNA polymerase sigma factor [Arachidicoccus terrestris]UAY57104.1 sigma-70 family RNA polymerase sigma factor [Arachidicoccus terrestris]
MDQQINLGQTQLLQEIARGDEQAFKQLVDTYSDRLGLFIAAITKDHQLAQEVVQDVFLKIWQNRESLIAVNNFQNWLFVISKHRAINALRRAISLHYTPDEQIIVETDNQDLLLEKERRFCLLDEAVANLPEQQRKVYLLSRRGGKTYKQIAAELELSPGTVKKYLQLAVAQIIKQVEKGATLTFFIFFLK